MAQKGLPPLPSVTTLPGEARWSALLHQAQWALAQVSTEMQAYYEQRSEAWQDSERGESFQEHLEAVQELVAHLAEVQELSPLNSKASTKKSAKNP